MDISIKHREGLLLSMSSLQDPSYPIYQNHAPVEELDMDDLTDNERKIREAQEAADRIADAKELHDITNPPKKPVKTDKGEGEDEDDSEDAPKEGDDDSDSEDDSTEE